MNKRFFLPTVLFVLFIISLVPYVKDLLINQDKFWQGQVEDSREIASAQQLIDPLVLEDYLINETYNKYISYELEPRFWTSLDSKYLKRKAFKAINETFSKSFIQIQNETQETLPTLLKNNLTKSIVKNYVKTLNFYKIFNGAFQFDFNFTPKEQRSLNYIDELSTNQLVMYNQDINLYHKMINKQVSLTQKVYETKVPNSGELFQYNGGSISVWFKLLDLNLLKIQNPIPNPKKNALKGYVRYRKYIRINEPSEINLEIKDDLISTSLLQFQNKSKSSPIYMTVDIYQNFNLKNLIPTNDKMVIHFGKIIPNNLNRDSIFKSLLHITSKEKSIKTASLTLHGSITKDIKKQKFKSKIKKLVYSFKDQEFTNESKITTTLRGTSKNSINIKNKIKRNILKKYKSKLIKSFKLDQFSSSIGQ